MTDNKPDRFYIYSNSGGCPQNQLDGGRIVSYLQKNDYVCSKKESDSDVLIVNSCAYNNLKEIQSYEKTIEFNDLSNNRKLVLLTGCLPKIAPDRLRDLPKDIVVIPGCELDSIEEIIPPKNVNFKQIQINYIPEPLFNYSKRFRRLLFSILSLLRHNLPIRVIHHFDHLLMYDHTHKSFIVEICKGCLGSCTYCVIRRSRGRLKSRPINEIIDEIKNGIKNDITEILLTATETAAYGLDIGTGFSSLLKEILNIITNQQILIFYANPKWLIKDWNNLESVFATGKIHFIHLSLNGGSNNVLKKMSRGYTLEEFENLIIAIKKSSPETVLQTQIITGFPGETEADFNSTLDFFRRTYFHNVQVHAFDPRKGTEAASMPDQIPDDIKQKRRRILYRLTLKRKIAYNLTYIMSGFKPLAN